MITRGIKNKPRAGTAAQANPDKILSKVWPDIKLANNRIDKLNTRRTWETNSIKTGKGARGKGAPGGKKRLRKCLPFLRTPRIFIPIKIARAKEKVTIEWLVTVKLYGIIPCTLHIRIIIEVVKIRGKNFLPLGPALSLTTFNIRS